MADTRDVLFRVPVDLLTEMDARVKLTGRSRNDWLIAAVTWALTQPMAKKTVTTVERI